MDFRVVGLDDNDLRELLDEYFEFRKANAAAHGDAYHVFAPQSGDFAPPHGAYIVAVGDDGRALGCGGIKQIGDGVFEVKNVWTRPSSRGAGVAATVIARLEEQATAWGARTLRLDTNHTLATAIRLYRRLGYHEIPPYNDNPNATNWFEKVVTSE